jgi:hypothetical protein
MTSKQFILSKYPEAHSFKVYGVLWYVILHKSDIESDYYGNSPRQAWVNAKKKIMEK